MQSQTSVITPKQLTLIEQLREEVEHTYVPEPSEVETLTKQQASELIDRLRKKKAVKSAIAKQAIAEERINYAAFGMAFKLAVKEANSLSYSEHGWPSDVIQLTVKYYKLYSQAKDRLVKELSKGGSK